MKNIKCILLVDDEEINNIIAMEINYKMLIVEDEPDIMEFLSYHFTKKGIYVSSERNGLRALDVLEYFKSDIIVSDIAMPIMDGIKMCRHLKEQDDYKNITVLFLSGVNDDYRVLSAMDAGGDQFLSKPAAITVLTQMVFGLLEKKSKANKR